MFTGLFRMHSRCPECDFKFEREQGFFVGAMYVNYGGTVAIVLPGYWFLDFFTPITLSQQLALWVPFAALFPVFFFRHSRSLWLALDYWCNPEE